MQGMGLLCFFRSFDWNCTHNASLATRIGAPVAKVGKEEAAHLRLSLAPLFSACNAAFSRAIFKVPWP